MSNIKKTDVLVSLIVPIYNTGKFLKRCIDSLINQTYKNIEIILVNDGSTDLSESICKEYLSKDNRVVFLNTEKHLGTLKARALGIKNARGYFTEFIDSDDFIKENAIEFLVSNNKNNEFDIVIFNIANIKSDIITYSNIKEFEGSIDNFFYQIKNFFNNIYFTSLCNKLYKTELLKASTVSSDFNILVGEDLLLSIDTMNRCKNIKIINEVLYFYCHDNLNSTSKVCYKDYYKHQMLANDVFFNFIKRKCKDISDINNYLYKDMMTKVIFLFRKYIYASNFTFYEKMELIKFAMIDCNRHKDFVKMRYEGILENEVVSLIKCNQYAGLYYLLGGRPYYKSKK